MRINPEGVGSREISRGRSRGKCLSLGGTRPKTSAPGTAEPQLRNDCLSFWSIKAELGLRGPRREGPVSFKIWYKAQQGALIRAVLVMPVARCGGIL